MGVGNGAEGAEVVRDVALVQQGVLRDRHNAQK